MWRLEDSGTPTRTWSTPLTRPSGQSPTVDRLLVLTAMQKRAVGQDTPEGTPCGGESTPIGVLQVKGRAVEADRCSPLTSAGASTARAG